MSTREFNQPTPNYQPEEELVTPYLKAKEEWDNRIGSARVQAFNWRICALASLLLCIILTLGLIYQSSKSKVVPYVVRVGTDGAVQTVTPVGQTNYIPQTKEIKYFLGQFLQNIRNIPLDPVVFRQNWDKSYAYLTPEAANKMNQQMKVDNPLQKLGTKTVQITINVIVPVSKNTYQIRWKEEVFEKGALTEANQMTGLFTIIMTPPTTDEQIMINPLGLYVKDFSWSKEL